MSRRLFALLLSAGIALGAAPPARAEIEVQWLGHATVRIVSEAGKVIVIDPYLSINPMTPVEYRDVEALGPVDLVLVTHGHPDHIADLVPLVKATGARVIAPYELVRNLISAGEISSDQITLLGKGGYVEPLGRGIRVHMVRAEHSSSLDLRVMGLQDLASVRHVEGGEPSGYVIEFETGFTLYHAGDTAPFGDMKLIGDFFEPDLALVPIGGVFTMGPEGAAYSVRELIRPKATMPIHFGTYPVINRTPEELIEALGDSEVEVIVMEPGETRGF